MMSYVSKIRAKVSIFARKKTSNIFDGSYKSVYQGNGLDFENLREYIPGDNIRDIDWKSSSRSGKLLVKKYIAEKKHNVMLVLDTGRKMTAHTKGLESKKKVALHIAGTIGYFAASNGDNVGAVFNKDGLIQYFQLKTGVLNLERILTEYDKENGESCTGGLEKSLGFIIKNINRRMIVVIVSDEEGLKDVSEETVKRLTCQHDVLSINVSDAEITSGKAYNVSSGAYVPDFISRNKKLIKVEKEVREKMREDNVRKLLKYGIVTTEVDSEDEVVNKVIELLERNKYAVGR